MNIMNKTARRAGIGLAVVFVGAQFFGPARTNPASDPANSLYSISQPPPAVAATLQRSCNDCHTNQTNWLWYNRVAPVSWWTIDHVNHAREHLNFSDWKQLHVDGAAQMLSRICEEIEAGKMPLPSYLWMHGDARLTADDKKSICLWTVETRNKLLGKSPAHETHK